MSDTHTHPESTPAERVEATSKVVGMIGLYDKPDDIIQAAERVRDAGWKAWDCHTPYPVHGLDDAMGLAESKIPWLTLSAGFLGVLVALGMQGWMSALDYPVRIGGKPLFSWPAFVPITFEFFVLFAALATFGAVIVFCKLGRWHSPLHDSGVMRDVTTHRFGLVLSSEDPQFKNEASARALLEETGCQDIRPLIERLEEGDALL